MFEHVECTLDSQETVRLFFLSQAVKEYRQIMVIVELFDLRHLPVDPIADALVLHRNGKITALVESPELRVGRVLPSLECSGDRGLHVHNSAIFLFGQRGRSASGCVVIGRLVLLLEIASWILPRSRKLVSAVCSHVNRQRAIGKLVASRPLRGRDSPRLIEAREGLGMLHERWLSGQVLPHVILLDSLRRRVDVGIHCDGSQCISPE